MDAFNERFPRKVKFKADPASPSLFVISRPAILPCIASNTLLVGTEVRSLLFNEDIEPVTSLFFITPYPTTTTSSNVSESSTKITFTILGSFALISCVVYPI